MANKNLDVLKKVRFHLLNGTYILAKHALQRQMQRQINLPDVLYVLEFGRHEETKDSFDVKRQAWKYAVRGRTLTKIELRIIVAFQDEMVIITVMKI
jgi:hypothetical protein